MMSRPKCSACGTTAWEHRDMCLCSDCKCLLCPSTKCAIIPPSVGYEFLSRYCPVCWTVRKALPQTLNKAQDEIMRLRTELYG